MTRPVIALCLGGALTVWEELAEAQRLVGDVPTCIVACNHAGLQFDGHLDAWATLHPELFQDWIAARAAAGRNTDFRAFTHRARKGLQAEVLPWRWFGSSGLYTAQVAIDRLGCAGAILCGVPLDGTGGHIHHGGIWDHAFHYRLGLQETRDTAPPVRSMSGFTQELFGAPDTAWLEGLRSESEAA